MEGNHDNLGDNKAEVVGAKRRTLGDYVAPNAMGCTTGIVHLPIQVNNFEIKQSLPQLVQQEQFGGNPLEDPHLHIANF